MCLVAMTETRCTLQVAKKWETLGLGYNSLDAMPATWNESCVTLDETLCTPRNAVEGGQKRGKKEAHRVGHVYEGGGRGGPAQMKAGPRLPRDFSKAEEGRPKGKCAVSGIPKASPRCTCQGEGGQKWCKATPSMHPSSQRNLGTRPVGYWYFGCTHKVSFQGQGGYVVHDQRAHQF